MLNIDTRLLNLLNGDEIAVFLHILKRVGKNNKSFPSRYTLQKETAYGRRRISDAIKGLTDKKIIEIKQQNQKGNFGKTIYKIKTDLAGVYISAKNEEIEEKSSDNGTSDRDTGNRTTVNRTTVNRTTETGQVSINQFKYYSDQEINYIKSVCEEKKRTPPQNDFEVFKEDIKKRFPNYHKFDLKYYYERVNLYLMQNPHKKITDFTAYVVSFMLGDQTEKKEKLSKKSSGITVFGDVTKVPKEERQERFKAHLFNNYNHRFKLDELQAFYNEFSQTDSDGVLLIEKCKTGLSNTIIDAYLKQLQTS